MAAMAVSAPVCARACGTTSSLGSSSLRGKRVDVKFDFVKRAAKAGGLEVTMTATLPPKFK